MIALRVSGLQEDAGETPNHGLEGHATRGYPKATMWWPAKGREEGSMAVACGCITMEPVSLAVVSGRQPEGGSPVLGAA